MHEYQAPLTDMKFVLRELVDLKLLAQLPGFGEMTPDVADAVLDEAAKFAGAVLSPLNRSGDLEGARWQEGQVLTAAQVDWLRAREAAAPLRDREPEDSGAARSHATRCSHPPVRREKSRLSCEESKLIASA